MRMRANQRDFFLVFLWRRGATGARGGERSGNCCGCSAGRGASLRRIASTVRVGRLRQGCSTLYSESMKQQWQKI